MKRGFTLMELLIVIAVIGILMSIASVAYSSAQKKTRDSRRKSDMKAVQNAMEQYYADTDASYPAAEASLVPTYFPAGLPADPKPGGLYVYTYPSSGYCVCATLESGGGNATDTSCTFASGSNYCVKNLQ